MKLWRRSCPSDNDKVWFGKLRCSVLCLPMQQFPVQLQFWIFIFISIKQKKSEKECLARNSTNTHRMGNEPYVQTVLCPKQVIHIHVNFSFVVFIAAATKVVLLSARLVFRCFGNDFEMILQQFSLLLSPSKLQCSRSAQPEMHYHNWNCNEVRFNGENIQSEWKEFSRWNSIKVIAMHFGYNKNSVEAFNLAAYWFNYPSVIIIISTLSLQRVSRWSN
jgi:hypothetical protein